MVILLFLCSSQFREDLSGWFSFKGTLCNRWFLCCSEIKYNACNSELYCAFRSLVGCQSDPRYQRYSKLSRVWSCTAPWLCLQLLKSLGMACLGNSGGTLELHEFLFFSKCSLTKVVVWVLIHDLHCFTEGFFMCNSCTPVACTSLSPLIPPTYV